MLSFFLIFLVLKSLSISRMILFGILDAQNSSDQSVRGKIVASDYAQYNKEPLSTWTPPDGAMEILNSGHYQLPLSTSYFEPICLDEEQITEEEIGDGGGRSCSENCKTDEKQELSDLYSGSLRNRQTVSMLSWYPSAFQHQNPQIIGEELTWDMLM